MISIKPQYYTLLQEFNNTKKPMWASSAAPAASNLTSEVADLVLREAIAMRASDIHIENRAQNLVIRYRIDGTLYDVLEIEKTSNITIIPRIKILSNIPTDAASSRKSFDGRFSRNISGHDFDFRIATFPTVVGEKVALRILNKNSEIVNLKKIGLSIPDHDRLERIIQRKQGLLVVSGPTGGGKTTTLYSILRQLQSPAVNIVTLEDPVEYQIDGINQCDLRKGEDFITGLKSLLRQDPDIILIGEVRDQESAEIAIRASLTGHLVITSLHANDAIGTVVRLINMGLERHIVSYALIGSVAQRLVRRICPKCRTGQTIDAQTLSKVCRQCGLNPKFFMQTNTPSSTESGMQYLSSDTPSTAMSATFYKGTGCDQCAGTGFHGRIGIFEVLRFTEELREGILRSASSKELEAIAAKDGFQTLAEDALQKVKAGLVTLDDVYPILLEESS